MKKTQYLLSEFLSRYTTKAEALRELNKKTGMRYRQNKIYEWTNGSIPIPPVVSNFLKSNAMDWCNRCGCSVTPKFMNNDAVCPACKLVL